MKKSKKTLLIIVALFVAIGGLFALNALTPGQYDELALCLKEKQVKFYGAFWCSNCEDQKEMFGKSAKKLPYIECSPSNRQGQLPVCVEADITAYPTWEFADGSREVGVMSLADITERAECALSE